MFEIGYKMMFFGEDARIASKEFGVACFPKRNFLNAWIPPHRKYIYLRKYVHTDRLPVGEETVEPHGVRLLRLGHKVGIVEQTETAALKAAGDTRNELFRREVTHMYTAATSVSALSRGNFLS